MYAKSTRPSVKREVQKEPSAKRAMRMCPRSGQIFLCTITTLITGIIQFKGQKCECFLYSQETQLNGNNYLLKNTKVNHICITIFLHLYREYIYCVSFNCQKALNDIQNFNSRFRFFPDFHISMPFNAHLTGYSYNMNNLK